MTLVRKGCDTRCPNDWHTDCRSHGLGTELAEGKNGHHLGKGVGRDIQTEHFGALKTGEHTGCLCCTGSAPLSGAASASGHPDHRVANCHG